MADCHRDLISWHLVEILSVVLVLYITIYYTIIKRLQDTGDGELIHVYCTDASPEVTLNKYY